MKFIRFWKDADIDENAIVHYSVQDDVNFEIDELSGLISTKQELDFETQNVHKVIILAEDKDGSRTGKGISLLKFSC